MRKHLRKTSLEWESFGLSFKRVRSVVSRLALSLLRQMAVSMWRQVIMEDSVRRQVVMEDSVWRQTVCDRAKLLTT